jgi:hypothetical protein
VRLAFNEAERVYATDDELAEIVGQLPPDAR